MEREVDTVLIIAKKLKLRSITGLLFTGFLKVYECENPYVLIVLVNTDDITTDDNNNSSLRMDIHKEHLASELRLWLEGKRIRNPAVLIPIRIEDAINRFVKFGKTPLQEDLILWLLSRSEIYLGDTPELVFGGKGIDNNDTILIDQKNNEYLKNSLVAQSIHNYDKNRQDNLNSEQYRIDDAFHKSKLYELQATKGISEKRFELQDLGMFAMTRKLLGKSVTLDMVKKSKMKGREGARQSMNTAVWSSEQYRLVADVEKARKNVELAMDERRRMIEVAKARQLQAADRYRQIRENLRNQQGAGKFVTTATNELLSLQKIQVDIMEDIKKQRNRAQRSTERVRWTMAPIGFSNRRGSSQKGPVIGPGPLHPNATSSLRDPRINQTLRKYYWDSTGRRHLRDSNDDDDNGGVSLIEKAMEAIRRVAANISAFKLDLKKVFEQFDTSGDGFLSQVEMTEAFLNMGVPLDIDASNAIFKHFDPNNSGSVHYGEFIWAFFNRRGLVRQWKHKTKGMTEVEIKRKFHMADNNGDGRLNYKEFKKLMYSFSIDINDQDIDILVNRFDLDHDGELDLNEFRLFIESEQKNLHEVEGTGGFNPSKVLPLPMSKPQLSSSSPPPLSSSRPSSSRPSSSSSSPYAKSTDDWQVSSSTSNQNDRKSSRSMISQQPRHQRSSSAPRGSSSGNSNRLTIHGPQKTRSPISHRNSSSSSSRHPSIRNQSSVEYALETIRKVAENKSNDKFNLKKLFQQFDHSGDGFLTLSEMAEAFVQLGVHLNVEELTAIFNHFDVNNSGAVHYDEFVWAFYNRRKFLKQWKDKISSTISTDKVNDQFNSFDIDQDGKLNPIEFKSMLSSFGMDITSNDIDSLLSRFDVDGDNMIDLNEFKAFMNNGLQHIEDGKAENSNTAISKTINSSENSVDVSSKSNFKYGKKHQTYPLPSNGTRPTSVNPLLVKIDEHESYQSHDDDDERDDDDDDDDDNHEKDEEEIDSLWLARMLKAQAEVEARVGKRYFK